MFWNHLVFHLGWRVGHSCSDSNNSNREHPMKHWHRATLGVVAGVLVGTAAFAEDWPQWRGPNRDGKVTGFTPPATWPKALAQKWKTTVGEGDSSPALVGDRLYVFTRQGADEFLYCLN